MLLKRKGNNANDVKRIKTKSKNKNKSKTIYNNLRVMLLRRRGLVERVYQIFTVLLRIKMFKEWFEALAIHLEGVSIVWIFNFHGSVWIDHLNNERASPTRAELSKK